MMALLSLLAGVLFGLLIVATILLITVYRFLRGHDVNMFTDDWYPVRVRKFPFTTGGTARSIR